MKEDEKIIKIGAVCGIIAFLLLYSVIFLSGLLPGGGARTTEELLSAFGNAHNRAFSMGVFFLLTAFGLLMIVSLLGFHRFLTHERPSFAATLAAVYGCIAFTLITIMLLIQGTVKVRMGEIFSAANETERQVIVKIYRSMRAVDFGIDLGWYVFICISVFLLGISMFRNRHFGPKFAIPGMLVGIVLLTINVVTVLTSTPRSNLIDLCLLWFLIASIQLLRKAKFVSKTP